MSSQKKAWPKVTVIVVNWNGERFLERCLTALQMQTVALHEVILVDNASSDASLEVVGKFPSVRVLEQKDNLGFARANNLALRAASSESEWIALLNPDAYAEPQWLEALLRAAQDHPEFDALGSKLVDAANPSVLDGAGDAYHVSGLVWRMGHGNAVGTSVEKSCEVFSPCAAAALYSRSALTKVGGFDEDFFCYVEDVDLGFRMRLAGYRCLYVPASVAHHVGSGSTGGQHSNFAVYHGHRNLVWAYVKNMPGVLFWVFLPLHVAMNLVALLVFALRGQGGVMLRAKLGALKGVPRMWRKRRDLQANRTVRPRDIFRMMSMGLR